MPDSLAERIAKSKANSARLEHDHRVAQRQACEAQKRLDKRRNYILGELVTKYFPEVAMLEPGTQVENKVTFAPVETFLAILSHNKKLVKEIKRRASEAASAAPDEL